MSSKKTTTEKSSFWQQLRGAGKDKEKQAQPEGLKVEIETKEEAGSDNVKTIPVFSIAAEEGASSLVRSLDFLRRVVRARLLQHFGKAEKFEQPDFVFHNDESPFAQFVIEKELSVEAFILLLLAIAPHAYPDLFTDLIADFIPKGSDFPEFGGVRGSNNRGILPTGETALFVLAGTNLDRRFNIMGSLFIEDHVFAKERILTLETLKEGEPEMSGRLVLSKEYVSRFLTGKDWQPSFSGSFPAKLITTKMTWEDLVLPPSTFRELAQIKNWLAHETILLKDEKLGNKIKPGYRALFYGPPGTGKTLTASLLGREFNKSVYRIDLSMIISKYIGETEKNLHNVFETAANKNWILFFDEADALFGKRTNVSSAHDRYANQEISYLLQKVEDHPGLVILASNFKNNVDTAFMRRFNAIISFPMPEQRERRLLWERTLPSSIPIAPDVNVDELSRQYELSGASIVNVSQMSSIRALAENEPINKGKLLEEIRKEYNKEGRTL